MPEPEAPRSGGIRAPLRPSANGHAKRTPVFRAPRRPSRIASIRMGLIAGIGALIVLVIFIAENAHTVHVTFLGAHAMVSLAVALLVAAIAGALVMAAAGTARITQLRRTIRRTRQRGHARAPAGDTHLARDTDPAGPASEPQP
jgi:putative membrane protein